MLRPADSNNGDTHIHTQSRSQSLNKNKKKTRKKLCIHLLKEKRAASWLLVLLTSQSSTIVNITE